MSSGPPDSTAQERFDPSGRADLESTHHWARYDWACALVAGARVLDCAAGPGYGSAAMRLRGAVEVVGVDRDEPTVRDAQSRYGGDGVRFVAGDALQLDSLGLGAFDCIVSLETIEHVADPRGLLDQFKAALRPGGVLLLSCPNDRALGSSNPYHLWTADYDEVVGWLRERFAHVAQHVELHASGSLILPLVSVQSDGAPPHSTASIRVLDALAPASAAGFLFLCSDRSLTTEPMCAGAMLADGQRPLRQLAQAAEWLTRQVRGYEQATRSQEAVIADLRAWVAALEAERDNPTRPPGPGWADDAQRMLEWYKEQLSKHQASLAGSEAVIAELRAWNRELHDGCEKQGQAIAERDATIGELRNWIAQIESGKQWLEAQVNARETAADALRAEVQALRAQLGASSPPQEHQ